MKQLFLIFVCCVSCFALQGQQDIRMENALWLKDKGPLVVYLSWGGNSRKIANLIAENKNGVVLEIKAKEPYSQDYRTVVERAKKEMPQIDSLNIYPTIEVDSIVWRQIKKSWARCNGTYLCYPIWMGRMAIPMQSFLNKNADFLQTKSIAAVVSSKKSDGEKTRKDLTRIIPNKADVKVITLFPSDLEHLETSIKDKL